MPESKLHVIWNMARDDATIIIKDIECTGQICLLVETISKQTGRLGWKNNRIRLWPGKTWTLEYDMSRYMFTGSEEITYFLAKLGAIANNYYISPDTLNKMFAQNILTPAEYYGVDMSELMRKGSREYALRNPYASVYSDNPKYINFSI